MPLAMDSIRRYGWSQAQNIVKLLVICISLFVAGGSANASEPLCASVLQKTVPLFGQGSVRHSIDLTRLKDERQPEAINEDSRPDQINYQLGSLVPFENYVQELGVIHNEMENHHTHNEKIDAVFYPLMGTDIALPLLVFPNAKTVVTIDRMPFLPIETARDNSPIPIKSARGGAWRAAVDITKESSVASRLLGALFETYPKVRILGLDIIEEKDSGNFRQEVVTASAILRFDLGDGKGERSLVYINESVTRIPEQIGSLLDRVWRLNPQAAIFKASMGLAKGGGYSGPPQYFGVKVIQQMKQQNGVILEGLSTEVMGAGGYKGRYDAELSGPLQAQPELTLHDHRLSYILPNHKFGYDVGVLVTDFAQLWPQ